MFISRCLSVFYLIFCVLSTPPSNTTGAISEAGSTYTLGSPAIISVFAVVIVAQFSVVYVVYWILLFVLCFCFFCKSYLYLHHTIIHNKTSCFYFFIDNIQIDETMEFGAVLGVTKISMNHTKKEQNEHVILCMACIYILLRYITQ